MIEAVERYRFTVDQYHRMGEAGIFSPDCRVELIDGEIFEMSPINPWHSGVVNRLNHRFVRGLGDRAVVHVQNPTIVDRRSEPQPDLMLLKPRADFTDMGENLFRDLGEQHPAVHQSLELDSALGLQRMLTTNLTANVPMADSF